MNAMKTESITIEAEARDAVVLAHAVRLGAVTVLTKKFPKERGSMVVQIPIPDGEYYRLFIAFSGHPEGDNGYLMYTAPRTPLGAEAIARIAERLCQDSTSLNVCSTPLSPCRN